MMRCEQITPYIPGFAGGDLRPDTARLVAAHVESCVSCRAEARRHDRVVVGLSSLALREVEPPAYLAESILSAVDERRSRRLVPVVSPTFASDVARVLTENREQIAQAGATALVAAGAAYALWRAVRRRPRSGAQPAIS